MKVEMAVAASIKITERDEHFGTEYRSAHGYICVKTGGKYSPCKHSVTDFVIDEDKRGQGYGNQLLRGIVSKYKSDIGGQVSSVASLHTFYKNGFRPALKLDATMQETLKLFKEEWGSLLMVYKPAKSFEE
jgi:GNAT superfamily N-acetyltransferase